MSIELVEAIINGDLVNAQDIFEQRLNDIQENKLYEEKRRFAAINEIVKPVKGKPGEFKGSNTKKDWAKYRKQNPTLSVHGTPDNPRARTPAEKKEKTSTGAMTKHGLAVRRKRGYLKAGEAIPAKKFIDAVSSYLEKKKGLSEEDFMGSSIERLKRAQKAPEPPRDTTTIGGKETTSSTLDTKKLSDAGKRKSYGPKKSYMDVKKLTSYGQRGASDDSISSGMRRTLRQKHRETTGVTLGSLAKKSFGKAFQPGKSLSGRYRSLSRAAKLASKTTAGRVVVGTAKRVGGGLADIGSQLEE
jgi:hypothetical protein